MNKNKLVTAEQLTGEAGEFLVAHEVTKIWNFAYRPGKFLDNGIDGEIEILVKKGNSFEPTGQFIKTQVKATRLRPKVIDKKYVRLTLSQKDLNYFEACGNLPVILFRVFLHSESRQTVYWVRVNHSHLDRRAQTIQIPIKNVISPQTKENVLRSHDVVYTFNELIGTSRLIDRHLSSLIKSFERPTIEGLSCEIQNFKSLISNLRSLIRMRFVSDCIDIPGMTHEERDDYLALVKKIFSVINAHSKRITKFEKKLARLNRS